MAFTFAQPPVPLTLRVCRSLVWTQAMFSVLAGVFVVLTAVMFGADNSIPFAGGALAGAGAAVLGAVYVAVGIALTYLAFELGRLAPWARVALVCAEAALAGLLLVRSLDLTVSTLVNVAFFAAIIALLFAPGSSAALRSRHRGLAVGVEAANTLRP